MAFNQNDSLSTLITSLLENIQSIVRRSYKVIAQRLGMFFQGVMPEVSLKNICFKLLAERCAVSFLDQKQEPLNHPTE